MGNPLESVGAYLREERTRRNVTLQEISDHTKINVRFLDALERGDYSILPAEAFIRGFIRAHARYIGVNPDEVIERLNQSAASEKAEDRTLEERRKPAHPKRSGSKKLVGVVSLTVILVVAAVSFAVYKMFTEQPLFLGKGSPTMVADRTSEESGAPPLTAEPKPTPQVGGEEAVVEEPPLPLRPRAPQAGLKPLGYDRKLAPQDAIAATEPIARADALRLSITASDETWVELSIDDGHEEERIKLDAGMTKTWLAREKFVLTLGNVKGTRIALNDRVLSLPFDNNNVLRNYTLTRETIQ